MSTETDIKDIKATIAIMGQNVTEIKTGIAVIQATAVATQDDVGEIKDTLKNHDGRIRAVEVGLGVQKTRTDTQSGIVATLSVIGSIIAAALGINR